LKTKSLDFVFFLLQNMPKYAILNLAKINNYKGLVIFNVS